MSKTRSTSVSVSNIDENTMKIIVNKLSSKITNKIDAQLEILGKQIEKMDQLTHSNKREIAFVNSKLDVLDQRSRSNTLRLVGMKEETDENLPAKVLHIFNEELKIKCTLGDLNKTFRSGKFIENSTKARTVIIEFVSYLKRNEIYKSRSNLKGTDLYLNEDLTGKRYHLLILTKKKYGGKNVWTANGRVFAKHGNNVKVINEEEDLNLSI
nr:uncharacterized protein LOC111514777 [Leptinotarsa decemlineata]